MKKIIFTLLICILFTACGVNKIEEEKFLFGTFIKIVVYNKDSRKAKEAINLAFDEIKRIDNEINSHSFNSEFYRLNEQAGEYISLSEEAIGLLKEAQVVSELSNGTYNIAIGELIELWDVYKNKKIMPNENEIKKLVEKINQKTIFIEKSKVKLKKGFKIESGSFLKGYAIYKARKILEKKEIKSAFITAISSIETIGVKPDKSKWKIGLQNPKNPELLLEVLQLDGKAIGVSGDYQNYYEYKGKRYHHIINAKTGYPEEKNKMTVVIGENSYITDLLSTALFSLDSKETLKIVDDMENIEIMIIDKDMQTYYSKDFKKYIKER